MAIFPFNTQTKKVNVLNPSHRAISKNVHPAQGLDGRHGGSYELQGARDSYIIIPNMENQLLDSRLSMTVVMFVYPMSPIGGPIVTFHDQGSIGIQISQDGVDRNGKGVLSATFNRYVTSRNCHPCSFRPHHVELRLIALLPKYSFVSLSFSVDLFLRLFNSLYLSSSFFISFQKMLVFHPFFHFRIFLSFIHSLMIRK